MLKCTTTQSWILRIGQEEKLGIEISIAFTCFHSLFEKMKLVANHDFVPKLSTLITDIYFLAELQTCLFRVIYCIYSYNLWYGRIHQRLHNILSIAVCHFSSFSHKILHIIFFPLQDENKISFCNVVGVWFIRFSRKL
jgi:hypothetical protein